MYRLLLLMFPLFSLISCALPAHTNTPFWQSQISHIPVEIQAPNQYLVDGFKMDSEALAVLLGTRAKQGLYTPIIITNKFNLNLLERTNYYEMAVVAEIAKEHRVDSFRIKYGLFEQATTSAELLSLYVEPIVMEEADQDEDWF